MKTRNFSGLILSLALSVIISGFPSEIIAAPQKGRTTRTSFHQLTSSPAHDFSSLWAKVDSLANLGQPKSALAAVDQIYTQAKSQKNDPQVIKAIIYRIRLNSEFQESFLVKTISGLRKEISSADRPSRQILQSILAEVYLKYFRNNQYRFRDRTAAGSNVPDSIETWDLKTISTAIIQNYLSSLGDAEILKNTPIAQYDAIMTCEPFEKKDEAAQKAAAAKFYPTLYDFLAGRALDFFAGENLQILSPAQQFGMDKPYYFEQTPGFISSSLALPVDSVSLKSMALQIFRDLAAFHSPDADPRALIDTELKRFAFVHENYVAGDRDSLYTEALRRFEKTHLASPWSTDISYVLAGFLRNQGQLYNPLAGDRHKWDLRSAAGVCEDAAKRFPKSEGAINCGILEKEIKKPSLAITAGSAVPVEKPSPALLHFTNVDHLWFRLVRANPAIYTERSSNNRTEDFFRYLASLPAVKSWSLPLPSDGDYQDHSAEIALPPVQAGFYVLICSTDEKFLDVKRDFCMTPFWATQISYITRRGEDGSLACFVLDRETGLPVKNAQVQVWVKNWDYRNRSYAEQKQQDLTADDQGFVSIPAPDSHSANRNIYFKIFAGPDTLNTDNFYQYPSYRTPETSVFLTRFYTDRAIYRPGQVICFKGITLRIKGDQTSVCTDKASKVVFSDANGQKIAEQNLVTNAFGSFSGSFTAPVDVLPGEMTISNEWGSVSLSVEEYKRPTFDVAYEPLEGSYRLGEQITVSGKAAAYAGNVIDGATVKYRVVRQARFPFRDWFWYGPVPVSSQAEIASGSAVTGKDGRFTFRFPAIPDAGVDKTTRPVFDYTVYADVTDLNGETQSALQTVSAGYQALLLGTNLGEMVNLSADSLLKITTTNLNGRPTPVSVTVTLRRLRQPGRIFRPRPWTRPDLCLMSREEFHGLFPYDIYGNEDDPDTWPVEETVFEKTVNTAVDSTLTLCDPSSLLPPARKGIVRPGSYLLVLRTTDSFGNAVERKQNFTAFLPSSGEVPSEALNWFVPLKTSGEPGESARFLIGSKEDNVNMICEIRYRDTIVSREWYRFSDHARVLDIPILEKYRGNFTVNFVFVKHNRVFQNSQLVRVPYSNKKLTITFESFRSKLAPGTKETWKIRIARPSGKPAGAEFMAGMYDASLDLFRPHEWAFDIYQQYFGVIPWDVDHGFRNAFGLAGGQTSVPAVYHERPLFKLNWFGFGYFGSYYRNSLSARGMLDKSTGAVMPVTALDETAEMKVQAPETITAVAAGEESPAKPKPAAAPSLQIRRDFRETAFFYPSLTTDSTGSLTMEFTVPGSLTKWKMLGLAHTQDLEYSLVEKELVTRKDLMVFPNAPRFVRQGDTVVFSTKIVNLADHDLSGTATLSLSDGLTSRSLDQVAVTGHAVEFYAVKGQSTSVSWKLIIPADPDLSVLQYTVKAISGDFADGEEKALPVLPNRMLVTESLPLPVRGKGTSAFTFDRLLKGTSPGQENSTLKNYRLTLEFASNPAWYAIQALPSLNDHKYENADAIFDAYWSNSMASHIANSDPKIKAVFEAWKSLTPDALQSNLAKNQQLKSALLQETPWVAEANSETGQKQKLGLYFDVNTIAANLKENLGKLKKLQTPNGGWTWFAGMPENRYTTQEIVTGMGRLNHLGISSIDDPDTKKMVSRAIGFLDGELVKDYENLKKYSPSKMTEDHLGSLQIQYLYARSYFMAETGLKIADPGPRWKEAFRYYVNQAEKYWLHNDRHLQGMIALALNRLGQKDTPPLIVKSLSEKALRSPEMGMYWADEQGYYWHQAPVETQALMIEVFDEVARNPEAVEELKIWLLKQKQTQYWRSDRATLEACYALLLRGVGTLSEDPGVKIILGKEKISSDRLTDIRKEAGTGYFRCSWSGNEIKPEMGNINISKSTQGIAWGAVYWQYFENLDKITPAVTPLKLEKKLFIERNTPGGPVLDPVQTSEVKATAGIRTGDKVVVRIVLSADRDLEFVHMKDMRAAGLEPNPVPNNHQEGNPGDGLSGYRYQEGLGYYQCTTDQATSFFFDYLPRGTYVFQYSLRASAAGEYSNGITTVQCMYAPEFTAHSEGIRIRVK